MKIMVFSKTRDGVANAKGCYEGECTIVFAGSKVRASLAKSVKGGYVVRNYLNDRQYVSENGVVLQDCVFSSPSLAAMFVTGCTSNGYRVWKTEDGKNLGVYLKENNLR